MLATDYARYYGIEAQREDESDNTFRHRVAGALRGQGHIIEAHEAQQDAYYDQSDNVMAGILGAVYQEMNGVAYGSTGERLVGDDIAIGHVVSNPKPEVDPLMLLMAMMMR